MRLERHPRFHLHFTPTSASWMNMVERFFRDLSQQAILPGSFGSVAELVENATVALTAVIKANPAASKGKYLKAAYISSTMGPGIPLDTTSVEAAAKV